MGSVLASTIMAAADLVLLNASKTRWPDAEKFSHINSGQIEVVTLKPDAHAVIDTYKLITGVKQRIPDGSAAYLNPSSAVLQEGIQVLKVIRNMGTAGATPGRAVDSLDMDYFNAANPTWPADTGVATVQAAMFDPRFPKYFYCYPPQPNANQGYVEVAYSAVPAEILAGTESIAYTSGSRKASGANGVVAGDTIVGATGAATGLVVGITLTSGTWGGGTAAGTIYFRNLTGTFQAENLNVGSDNNIATVGGASTNGTTYAAAISLDDSYQLILLDYLLYRCYLKDASLNPVNKAKSIDHWNRFVTALGRKDLVEQSQGPNVQRQQPSTTMKPVA